MRKLINVMIVFLLILGPLVKTNQIEESTSRLVFFSSQASLDYCDNETRKLTWSEAGIATSADGPFDIFAADMDNDGDIDILSASENDDTIAWYENDGASDPSWTASNITTIADYAVEVHAADMDGDGDMDIVSASQNDDTIAWYENDGASDPSWTKSNITTTADSARSIFVADMDGDGDMDILSASKGDDTIAWYENDGASDPSWTASDIATNASRARSVFAADMDNDGDMDILSASQGDDTIAWYENDGAINPSWIAIDIATSADGAHSVFAADMDNDGDIDILSASENDDTIAWYENDGASDPRWTASDITNNTDGARVVFVSDIDNDGDMDILSASANDDTIAWYENDGASDPSWTKSNITTTADHATSVFTADIDSDGDMDVLSASYNDDKIAWYENEWSCEYPPTEGCMDVNAINYNSTVEIDNGSCEYPEPVEGCMDVNATNYNSDAKVDDSSCEYPEPVEGCMDVNAINYNSTAVINDDSCEYLEEPSGFCPTEITDENKDTVDDACIVPVDETEDPKSNEDEGFLPSISLFTAISAVAIIAFRRR